MGILITAYLIAWAVVCAFVSWLAVQNARLDRRLKELEAHREEREGGLPVHARAA